MENTTKKCPHCGCISNADVKFCRICGKEFIERADEPIVLEIDKPVNNSSASKALPIIIVILVAGLLIGALGWMLSSSAPKDLEQVTYRMSLDDNIFSIQHYSYKNDVVYSIKDTVEIRTSNLTQEDIDAYLDMFGELAFECEGVDCIKLIREVGDSKLILGFEYSDLGNKKNVEKLMKMGYISPKRDIELISISQTEKRLLDLGYRMTTVS